MPCKLTLEGNNYLYGGASAPGLGFTKATPNVDGVTNGSTLTIQGEGSLETKGGFYAAGIGSGYNGWEASAGQVSNIIINSGNITAEGGTNGCGIGSALYGKVNNIVINGGNINVDNSKTMRYAIGATGSLDNLIINGGTIVSKSNYCAGIFSTSGNIKINGGTIFALESKIPIGKLGEDGTTLENCIPTDGTNNLYLTPIQLKNMTEKSKVTSLTISDNINYGITDMYTSEDNKTTDVNEGGMIYLYLPKGSRTITIKVDGKNYSGTVETTEEGNIETLN